jgi:hypothetical protein
MTLFIKANHQAHWQNLLQTDQAVAHQKKPTLLKVVFAESDGICQTLEGEVPYHTGDAIVTGTEGEVWPIKRDLFEQNYEPAEGGLFRKKPITVWALCLTEDTELEREDGAVLKGRRGDWLVQYAPGDQAIVRGDIFEKTYEQVSTE